MRDATAQKMTLWATTPTVAFTAAKPAAPGMSAAPIVSVASRRAAQITAAAGITHHRPMMKLGSKIVGITGPSMSPRRVAAGSHGVRALAPLSGNSRDSNPPPPLSAQPGHSQGHSIEIVPSGGPSESVSKSSAAPVRAFQLVTREDRVGSRALERCRRFVESAGSEPREASSADERAR